MKFWVVEVTDFVWDQGAIRRNVSHDNPMYVNNAPGGGLTADPDKAKKYNTLKAATKSGRSTKHFYGGTVRTIEYAGVPTAVEVI